ncbi:MAG: DUF4911 domain-containing protein [bacterium]
MSDFGGLEPIFLRLAPVDIALVKFVFELYEEVGIIRTIDRETAVIVALISRDFLSHANAIIADLQRRIAIEVIEAPADSGDDWLLKLLR